MSDKGAVEDDNQKLRQAIDEAQEWMKRGFTDGSLSYETSEMFIFAYEILSKAKKSK